MKLPPPLRNHAGGASQVDVGGATVEECLSELQRRLPKLGGILRDEDGQLASAVSLYLNGEDVRYRGGLATPVADGDELTVVVAIAGGGRV